MHKCKISMPKQADTIFTIGRKIVDNVSRSTGPPINLSKWEPFLKCVCVGGGGGGVKQYGKTRL